MSKISLKFIFTGFLSCYMVNISNENIKPIVKPLCLIQSNLKEYYMTKVRIGLSDFII